MIQPSYLLSRWGERTKLIGRRTSYVFSLDFSLTLYHQRCDDYRVRIGWERPANADFASSTFHVFDDEIISADELSAPYVPILEVRRLYAWMSAVWSDFQGQEAARIEHCTIELQDEASQVVTMECNGIVNVPGGMRRVREGKEAAIGSAFIVTRQEVNHESSKYRWLSRIQLLGFGQVLLSKQEEHSSTERQAQFNFDMYSPTSLGQSG